MRITNTTAAQRPRTGHGEREGSRRSPSPAASLPARESPVPAFSDNRPESAVQRKLLDLANASPRVGHLVEMQQMIDESPRVAASRAGLPPALKSGIEALSGISVDDVTVHYDSLEPARLEALACTRGTEIHVAPGQERHLPHEAWHVVQQKQGRVAPTSRAGDTAINDEPGLEREADVMGNEASRIGSLGARGRQATDAPSLAPRPAAGATQNQTIQLFKGKVIFKGNPKRFFVRYYPNNTPKDVPVHDVGVFDVGDKVNFDIQQNLAVNLRRIEREYIIPGKQGTGMEEILLGIKRTHYQGNGHPLFAGGMPAVIGGDVETGETPADAVEREMREEIGHDVGVAHPVLTRVHSAVTKRNHANVKTETAAFNTAPDVIPANFVLNNPTDEMASTFFLRLDDVTADLGNKTAVMQEICQIAGINIDIHHLTEQETEFRDSSTLDAIIKVLRNHRTERYRQGLVDAQDRVGPRNNSAAYLTGYHEYAQGWQDAQAGQNAATDSFAYMVGYDEYQVGLQHGKANQAADNDNPGYMAGYNAGRAPLGPPQGPP